MCYLQNKKSYVKECYVTLLRGVIFTKEKTPPLAEKLFNLIFRKILNGLVNVLKLVSSNFLYFTKRKHFKNYGKRFLFHLKSSFHSRDIQFFVFSFPSFP